MTWDERPKAERKAIRREMLKQAELALAGSYTSKSRLRSAARTMVDQAIAKERHETQSRNTQCIAIQ